MSINLSLTAHRFSDVILTSISERPDLAGRAAEFALKTLPTFICSNPKISDRWSKLFSGRLTPYQLIISGLDRDGVDRILAVAISAPLTLTDPDDDSSLPDTGWDFILNSTVAPLKTGSNPNVLAILSIAVAAEMAGSDLPDQLHRSLAATARGERFRALVALVRPSEKANYPLASFDDYVEWRNEGGAPFDPLWRKHWQLGASFAKVAAKSLQLNASLSEWAEWSGLKFPVSGPYHLQGGLAPLMVDRGAETAAYQEASVWLRYPLYGAGL